MSVMSARIVALSQVIGRWTAVMVVLAAAIIVSPVVNAQVVVDNGYNRTVGGISINADGVLANAAPDQLGKLSQLRLRALEAIPADLKRAAPERKVSLRRLEAAIQENLKSGRPLADEIKYLAGLQQIRYVFVYPEQNDIVLVGPGEGWKVDARGNIVGLTSGRPVMLLDDLLVALRTARSSAREPISCSIDPTADGLNRLRTLAAHLRQMSPQVVSAIEEALGQQQITFTGVPTSSHFARVLIAADYRMKRLGMGFDQAPFHGLPSYLSMMGGGGHASMLGPRWWLEPKYEPLLKSGDGLAWELRGGSVVCMTEEDFLTASGNREHSGKASPMAQKWADGMTKHYDELSVAEPIFGQLRNCMELAVVGVLLVKENLLEKAGHSMPVLMDTAALKTEEFLPPKQVPSKASVLKKGHNWLISASGGVNVKSWAVADKTQASDAVAPRRAKAVAADAKTWWWN